MDEKHDIPQLFKSLSDPVRLRILNLLLAREELCVCDIMSLLELPQSLVSRHLSYLRKHGLVESRRKGNWQYYCETLSKSPQSQHAIFSQHLSSMLASEVTFARDLARLNEQNMACCD